MRESYGVQKGACTNDSTMIRLIRICRKCGAKIFSDAPEGLCTACVLKTALLTPAEESLPAGNNSGSPENVETSGAIAALDTKSLAPLIELLGELGDYEL